MIKGLLFPLAVCLFTIPVITVEGQYYYYDGKYYSKAITIEIGGSTGIMNCLTDLGGRKGTGKKGIKDLNWKMSRPVIGAYLLAMYRDCLALKFEANSGSVQAADSVLHPVSASTFGRRERNLSFRSLVRDYQLSVEIHPLFFITWEEDEAPYWSPYLVGGIGYFSFDPKAKLDRNWFALQPLRTEGQGFSEYPSRKPYKLQQINIPIGVGVKYELSPVLNARFEIIHRVLFTDYLDDVSTNYINDRLFDRYFAPGQSAIARQLADRGGNQDAGSQRGNPSNNDAFFSVQVKLGITLRRSYSN